MILLQSTLAWRAIIHDTQKTHVIFKHSITCPISEMAYMNLHAGVHNGVISESVHLVRVQNHRELTRLIANETGIHHESPQILIIKNGKVVYHVSHNRIDAKSISHAISSCT